MRIFWKMAIGGSVAVVVGLGMMIKGDEEGGVVTLFGLVFGALGIACIRFFRE